MQSGSYNRNGGGAIAHNLASSVDVPKSIKRSPRKLRELARDVINRHVDQHQLEFLRTAEKSERELLTAWAAAYQGRQPTVTPYTKLIGLRVKLDRPIDRERPCCKNICTIGPGKVPHAAELRCTGCNQHRGWLSKSTARWIKHVATRFGAPTTPIVVHQTHIVEEEAPPAEIQTTF